MVNEDGTFSVTFDPLDGSSLMGVDLTVGTIVGIHAGKTPLRPAKELIGAMYILYGPLTVLVYTIGKGVHEFVLDDDNEFVLQCQDLKFGKDKIYAPGALRKKWLPAHRRFIERLEDLDYKLRFAGSMVADVHQVIHKGGVFTYPGIVDKPGGKLRLLFEAGPMGFIAVNAGGGASDGRTSILDIEPKKIDQRVPVYIGGQEELKVLLDEMSREV
jgi:fructose-1,6-bisphosphatase I